MSHRFLYQNRIGTGTAITASSTAAGFVGAAVPRVANGSGAAIFSGTYTGNDPSLTTVEIDGAGDTGAATFKWRNSATAPGAWEASGVATAAADTSLGDGVRVRFSDGASSPAFEAGDRWQATATRFRAAKRTFELDPNTAWRSGTPSDPESLVFDLGSAQEVKAAAVYGHNISSGGTVKIQGNTADAWGAPALEETIAWRTGTLHRYLTSATKTYRYWRLLIEGDSGNPDGYIEVSEVYLGDYFEPDYAFEWGNVRGDEAFEIRQETESKVEKAVLLNRGEAAFLPYRHVTGAQRDLFQAMFRAVKDVSGERDKPLFAHLDVDDPAALLLMRLEGRFAPVEERPDDYAFELTLRERLS